MSRVHKALEALGPREWKDIPKGDDLKSFLKELFEDAELVTGSVPQPPGGSPFNDSNVSSRVPHANSAKSAADIINSTVRSPDPNIEDLETLRKGWGKPYKLKATENPLGMTVWKMAGHDRHGAWFARRSIHEGLGFTRWKNAMQREFDVSLAVQGKPGEGSIRGIGADKRLEHEVVDGVGQLDVYQLSAQFPGPVAPREFVTCLLTSDTALSDRSAASIGTSKHIPRHYTVVSIPLEHPEAPRRDNPVRGTYESIEMIREIPIAPAKSKSTPNLLGAPKGKTEASRPRGLTVAVADSDTHSERTDMHSHVSDDPELNPVEWIMVTRSEPGGGIPRFMVERGTPGSIAQDAAKFLNWATREEEVDKKVAGTDGADEPEEAEKATGEHRQPAEHLSPAETNGHLAGIRRLSSNTNVTGVYEPSKPGDSGIIASLTGFAQSYAPNMLQERLGIKGDSEHALSSDSDSDDSFESSVEQTDFKTAYEGPRTPDALDTDASFSLQPDDAKAVPEDFERSSEHQHFEKEIKKLAERRRTLDERMAKQHEEEEKKRADLQTQDEKNVEKARERLERDRQKQEEKHKREIEKLEQRRAKEERRLEEKMKKARDKDSNARDRRERDEYRRRVELLQRENDLLRSQLGELQKENTLMVQKVGKLEQGHSALKQVREEMGRYSGEFDNGRARASSRASGRSGKSGLSSEVRLSNDSLNKMPGGFASPPGSTEKLADKTSV